jgi:hypothetical protein
MILERVSVLRYTDIAHLVIFFFFFFENFTDRHRDCYSAAIIFFFRPVTFLLSNSVSR